MSSVNFIISQFSFHAWVPQAGVPNDRSSSLGWRSLAFGDLGKLKPKPFFLRVTPCAAIVEYPVTLR
jgi:hypothetical protein